MSANTTGLLVKQSAFPTDGEYDFALYRIIDGREAVLAETFGRVGPTARFDAKALAHQFAASGEVVEAAMVLANAVDEISAEMRDGLPIPLRKMAALGDAKSALRAALAKSQGEAA
jgi:hypothetical protein